MSSLVKVVIPARYGSSRLPAKPLLEINGKPIFWHVAQRVLEAGIKIANIYIATDHKEIESLAIKLNLPVVMTEKEHVSGTERVNEVANKFGWQDDVLVINVQGDEPLIPPTLIKRLSFFAKENSEYGMTTVATPILGYDDFVSSNVVKVVENDVNQALYFTRSPVPYNRDNPTDFTNAKRHVGIYAYRVGTLRRLCEVPESRLEGIEKLEQLRALSKGCVIGVLTYDGVIPHGIDIEEDFQRIKKLMEQ
ncbi:3-deoxy-manno-octulosonate cytidylyltransferase [Pseudoalteromonas carrageenovora]|uniref:3-deoxy-manno-octulosonate cytidylyltransferase n=1 Tax=Pseudoalteromonas carrageenovora TaxID=227 RepID=UPI0026E12FDF|nr:3-deoxy-manno-octulosonate cytidylyltransferase [Pseudoalteromonas carrageenovora]MDO6635777.1 3-deoxy-manno-octulosonate cytidylyltransferase [Pseudoalteromonas carrageenovora]MDO6647770.1 3-deoxy-manno-octulosonate cytidylyltransferase [Pseudoalteromonas carrageenovora]